MHNQVKFQIINQCIGSRQISLKVKMSDADLKTEKSKVKPSLRMKNLSFILALTEAVK